MKYFFITASMIGGGTERVISVLANNFVQAGNAVTILMTANNQVDYVLDERIGLELVSTSTGGSIIKRINRLRRLRSVFKNNKDAVYYSFGTETNMFSLLASFGMKINLILSERNDPNQCGYKLLRDSIYCMGKKFVFQTEDARRCFSKRIQKNSVVISNPVRADLPAPYVGGREKTIVAVGRLEEQKNHRLLIEAFALFAKEYPEYVLKIYGQGALLEKLEEIAKQNGVADKVHFMGFTKNILEEIKSAEMYVLSSDYEGVPNSLLEAMAIGLPVISTDCPIGGSATLIKNEENGLLVPIGDREHLYMAMKRYVEDVAFAGKCGQNALIVRETNAGSQIADRWAEYGVDKNE